MSVLPQVTHELLCQKKERKEEIEIEIEESVKSNIVKSVFPRQKH